MAKIHRFILFINLCIALFNQVLGKNLLLAFLYGETDEFNFRPSENGIEVIGAGFGRTGTQSLKNALNILGYKTYHMDETHRANHDHLAIQAFNGKTLKEIKPWFEDMVKQGFSATVDFPTAKFYKEQLELYPKGKIILTTRDPEKWFSSMNNMLSITPKFLGRPIKWFASRSEFFKGTLANQNSKFGIGGSGCLISMEKELYEPWYFPWISYPKRATLNKTACILDFNLHNAEVRRTVPKEKFLDIEISDGWGPLCKFLNQPVPNIPFPSENSKEELAKLDAFLTFLNCFYPFIIVAILWVSYVVIKFVISCCAPSRATSKIKTQ